MSSARLLNQINKIRQADLKVYPSSFVVHSQILLKPTFHEDKAIVCRTGFKVAFPAFFVLLGRVSLFLGYRYE